jgi:hypothetical protein
VQTLQGDYDDFKAWHFNDTFRVRPGLTLNLGMRYEINPFFKGILHTRTGFDPSTGKIIVPTGRTATDQPLTGTLRQLFADRINLHRPTRAPAIGIAVRPARFRSARGHRMDPGKKDGHPVRLWNLFRLPRYEPLLNNPGNS